MCVPFTCGVCACVVVVRPLSVHGIKKNVLKICKSKIEGGKNILYKALSGPLRETSIFLTLL